MTQDVDTDAIEEARKARKREYLRAWRAANHERAREYLRAWRAANHERAQESDRAWRAANHERVRESVRAWRVANPERARESDRAWRAANREQVRKNKRAWRAANREQVQESVRARNERRIMSDPVSYKREIMLRSARSRSRLKNLAFDITIDDISAPITCPVLGIELDWRSKAGANNGPSLDRVIPELGYVRGNVMVISNRANRLKSDATAKELKALAKYAEVGYKATEHLVNKNDTKDIANDVEN